ncbi:arylesterase [Cocleimonas sp. KMM 6892]|uniref:arylesterase n=1 Tax=unclassified Cocleimonas TaxID=2639732 RepID=UPI002DBCD30B|nr:MULTISPECIES: arylesterase [unclassified Cocleimonas]MEB8430734.1 arylesterase [Cocleimonas sp. KMM 6892]MEC4714494.1 arylesterase [Cocleimonas sp. KMM 6895]MEC4743827.1 arylesterase [Cocleimonas sp. KMM 6896]
MGFTLKVFKLARRSFLLMTIMLFSSAFSSTALADQKILVWGDSLSAAYGIPREQGWVNLMRNELGEKIEVINGSISGETTQGGRTRLPKALEDHQPNYVVLELGANDGLRGIPPDVTKTNLDTMIQEAQKANAKVILFGMKIPPNYGVAYSEKFEAVFADLAKKYDLPFIPFFMEDIAQNFDYLQADELHPTASAQPLLLKKILPTIKKELSSS